MGTCLNNCYQLAFHSKCSVLEYVLWICSPTTAGVLPNARQQPEEEEEAIALCERRQEGRDTVYSQGHDQTAAAAHFVCQTAPHERSHHHAEKDDQTYRQRERIEELKSRCTWRHNLLTACDWRRRVLPPLRPCLITACVCFSSSIIC